MQATVTRMVCSVLASALCATLIGCHANRISIDGSGISQAAPPVVAATTLDGRVIAGYQGWFLAAGDGTGLDWNHFGAGDSFPREFQPGVTVNDYWPDMSEAGPGERYPTPFRHYDGSIAYAFSSANAVTVDRHFRWMREHGIDGAFLQRFGTAVRGGPLRDSRNRVLANVRNAANRHQRGWAVMYDLTGLKQGEIRAVVMRDWKELVDSGVVGRDPAYQRHRERPVVAVWGIGFRRDRDYSLEETRDLVDFLKNDPVYGGNTVILGVPYWWRTLERDAVAEPLLHEVIKRADVVSPWSVGRYRNVPDAFSISAAMQTADLEWCLANGLDYLPVIFPGFSWHNQRRAKGDDAPLDWIPRAGGRFFWAQGRALRDSGAGMAYVAMFDEMDEGTQIFKVSADPPVGKSSFLTYGDLPADHYLRLTGLVGAILRNELDPGEDPPPR